MSDIIMRLEREAGLPPDAPAVGVGFCLHPIKDEAASDKAGRIMFKEVEFVRLVIPGDKQSEIFVRADTKRKGQDNVERDYTERFPQAYRDFKQSGAKPIDGTPLEQWPAVSRTEVLNLKSFHIHTVEALAQVNDSNAAKLPFNIRELINKAKDHIATAKALSDAKNKDAQIEELKAQIAELSARMDKKKAA